MTTKYTVGITRREGAVDGWVFELPGCRAIGGSVDEVRELLPVVIAEYLSWLDERGEVTREAFPLDFQVVEEVTSTAEFCFEADKAPLSAEELEQGISRLVLTHQDLVEIVRPLPDVVLDWKPPASAVKIDNIYPDVRTAREMASHAAGSMSFFLRNIGDPSAAVATAPPDLFAAPETAFSRLRALSDSERSGVFRRPNPRTPGVEAEWSVRKVLRRTANHLRFHTREVQQRLCWLTLGLPEVMPVSRE